jgi:serine/threonine protein kinase
MTDDPLIGRKLSNFVVKRVLGRGGMAQVYYGEDIKLQRPVAIKVIDVRYRNKPDYAQRFVKEARVVAGWRHENIIQIYYADDQDGFYYYAMEYIDGEDLARRMSTYTVKGQFMPAAEILRIGRAVASALDYAHSKGVIHRDIKPSNILIAKDGRVVLSDFGLALDLQQGSAGEAFGSAHYISPEQARRSTDAVPQSDLYSLGVILYEMLTGVPPFDDESPTSVALQHITQAPPAPRSLNPQLNADTESVLLKALNKKPKERYQTGAALMDALASALAHAPSTRERVLPLPPLPAAIVAGKTRPVTQRPVTKPVVSPSMLKQRWPILAVLGVALLLLIFGTVALSKRFQLLAAAPSSTASLTATQTPPQPATATQTLSLSATLTRTLAPTATSTLTFTPAPTDTPAATETVTPTATLTDTPTATLDPRTPTATTTPAFANYKRFWLYYDAYGFYLYNASGVNNSIGVIAFERIDANGNVLNTFDGSEFSKYERILSINRCMRIEIQNNPGGYLNPPICQNFYLVSRSFTADNPLVFWTPQADSTQFRVMWKNKEAGLCEIAAGFCEIFVP